MKTTACLLVIVAALSGFVRAQSGNEPPDPKQKDPTIGPVVPRDIGFKRGTPGKASIEAWKKKYAGQFSTIVPNEALPLVNRAKEQFERGHYTESENLWLQALRVAPANLYLLSNLGVCQFRRQEYQASEISFKKALAVAPEDDFSHCTLGIVEYQQGKFDEAIDELTKALSTNPKNATAHNYFGITASQKGWPEVARKELETATTINPDYADAYFNLAVVLATQTPPDKEGARQHYQRALKLGAQPDNAFELMIK